MDLFVFCLVLFLAPTLALIALGLAGGVWSRR